MYRAFSFLSTKDSHMILERPLLARIGEETVRILREQYYQNKSGQTVYLDELVDKAVKGTTLYAPGELLNLQKPVITKTGFPTIEITNETTSAAGKRLVEKFQEAVVLNFASAKHPGGGFLSGARAQEEDLTRKSGLYPCLKPQTKYYTSNKNYKSCLYTDYLIYSPEVPFFRDEDLELLEEPYLLSVITSPAPNAGEELQKNPNTEKKIQAVLDSRSRDILLAAKQHGHRNLVLGAWGCGVFKNDPKNVAQAFLKNLKHPWLNGAFDHVVFAIYEFTTDKTLTKTFQEVFK